MMKASAIAHPIQGLIKYHGLRDPALRIPFHGSISVCTGPIFRHTTVERLAGGGDEVSIDGEAVSGRALERARTVLEAVRSRVGDDRPCRVESRNDFPQYVGLAWATSPAGLVRSWIGRWRCTRGLSPSMKSRAVRRGWQ